MPTGVWYGIVEGVCLNGEWTRGLDRFAAISFAKTAQSIGRDLFSNWEIITIRGANGRPLPKPQWIAAYRIKTKVKKNTENSWYVPEFSRLGMVVTPPGVPSIVENADYVIERAAAMRHFSESKLASMARDEDGADDAGGGNVTADPDKAGAF